MVRIGTVVDSLATRVRQSDELETSVRRELSVSTFEYNMEGGHSAVRPPAIEVVPDEVVRLDFNNSDFVGYRLDEAGNQIGKVYRTHFQMPVTINVLTAEGGSYDPQEIMENLERAFRIHDSRGPNQPLPDPEDSSQDLADFENLRVSQIRPDPDLNMTPALRRWRQSLTVEFYDDVVVSGTPVSTVEVNLDVVVEGDDGDVDLTDTLS